MKKKTQIQHVNDDDIVLRITASHEYAICGFITGLYARLL